MLDNAIKIKMPLTKMMMGMIICFFLVTALPSICTQLLMTKCEFYLTFCHKRG